MQNGGGAETLETRGGGGGGAASERAFETYGRRISSVQEFRYLWRVLPATDADGPAVARNLYRARATWGRMARILGREEDLLCHGDVEHP